MTSTFDHSFGPWALGAVLGVALMRQSSCGNRQSRRSGTDLFRVSRDVRHHEQLYRYCTGTECFVRLIRVRVFRVSLVPAPPGVFLSVPVVLYRYGTLLHAMTQNDFTRGSVARLRRRIQHDTQYIHPVHSSHGTLAGSPPPGSASYETHSRTHGWAGGPCGIHVSAEVR